SDVSTGIAVDSGGSAYVTGTTSGGFPTTQNSLQPAFAGTFDGFLSKVAPSGASLVYSTYIGGSGTDKALGVSVDSSASAYITGFTNSANFPTKNPFQSLQIGAFIAKVNTAGSALVYSSSFGGLETSSSGIAVDAAGNASIAGGVGIGTGFATKDSLV